MPLAPFHLFKVASCRAVTLLDPGRLTSKAINLPCQLPIMSGQPACPWSPRVLTAQTSGWSFSHLSMLLTTEASSGGFLAAPPVCFCTVPGTCPLLFGNLPDCPIPAHLPPVSFSSRHWGWSQSWYPGSGTHVM